jgi:hypothetical protein
LLRAWISQRPTSTQHFLHHADDVVDGQASFALSEVQEAIQPDANVSLNSDSGADVHLVCRCMRQLLPHSTSAASSRNALDGDGGVRVSTNTQRG